jgi:hypothetical protein
MHAFLKNAAAMLSTKSMSVGQVTATQGSLARHVRGGSRLSAAASLTAPSAALHIVDRREFDKSSCNQVSEVEHVQQATSYLLIPHKMMTKHNVQCMNRK